MSGFNGEDVAKLLDYTLASGVTGRVPSPTAGEARKYRDVVRDAQCRITGMTAEQSEEPSTDGELSEFDKRLNNLTAAERDQLTDDTIDATIEICKGSPSRDEITNMSGLEQVAFTNWLLGVLSPLF